MIKLLRTVCIYLVSQASFAAVQKYEVNVEQRIKSCSALVNKAVGFFEINEIDEVCRAFLNDAAWWHGDIVPFIFDDAGVCYVFGRDRAVIWSNFDPKKTHVREDFLKKMFDTGRLGGFVNFTWNNGYMHAAVRTVYKYGKSFIVGAGFYPDSARYMTEQLVRSVIEFAADHPVNEVFEAVNNPIGRFVHGDSYISIYRFDGTCVAHGRGLQLIGQNMIDEMTADGRYRTRDLIEIAKNSPHHGWYRYDSKSGGVEKDLYVEQLVSSDGQKYVVSSGYNPTLTERDVRAVVSRTLSYIKTHGTKQAFPEISQPTGQFAYGGITIFVYNMQGDILADMENPSFVGQNLSHSVDADGKFITKNIVEHAKKNGSGWLSFNLKNAYAMMYIEKLSLPDGDFVIGASFFPTGKEISVRFMAEKAALHLEATQPSERVFAEFASGSSDFLRGDVDVTVFRVHNGRASTMVSGQNRSVMWDSGIGSRDVKGRSIMKKIIARAQGGGGWTMLDIKGLQYRMFLRPVSVVRKIEGGKKEIIDEYIVASGYYL
jgi:hypothetical protein